MQLSKILIKNYRLLIDAELDVDKETTLIVGRNNTAKTSCMECIATVLNGNGFSYNDYPLAKRQKLCNKILEFMEKKIKYTKHDQIMAFLTVEDIVGSIEVIVFPQSYEKYSAKLMEENKVYRIICSSKSGIRNEI